MRQSNVCSPAQNQACLLITSRLYDRRGLDCTSPLPLFNSLAHLVHLTATSPKIREILTRDGGLERLVRILREFVQNPPPVQDPGVFYGLLPPIPVGSGNGNVATAIASLNPSSGPPAHYHQLYQQQHHQFLGGPPNNNNAMVDINYNPALVLDPAYPPSLRPPHHHHLQPHATHLQPPPTSLSQNPQERTFDRDAAQRFSLAFQSIVNVGVRGSESIRSRVVEAGTLEVVSTILEAWLVGKGFPLVLPRRGKKRDTNSANSDARAASSSAAAAITDSAASAAEDGDERMDEDTYDETASRPVGHLRSRNATVTPHGSSGRTRSEARTARPGSGSNIAATPKPSGSGSSRASGSASTSAPGPSSANASASGSLIPRPSGSRANQTTPRYALASLGSSQSVPNSSDSITSSANTSSASLTTPLDTPPASSATQQHQFPRTNGPEVPDTTGLITRGRSGTIIGQQRVRPGAGTTGSNNPSRANSTDDMDVGGSGRSGANTEDEDMDAESSNNENDESLSAANTSTEAVNDVGVTSTSTSASTSANTGDATGSRRPVAVADPQALSPHVHAESMSIQPGPGMGMGMGMEVDVLAAVNMVMAHEGVAAFEGTQFGGEAANAAAAEAMARAGREGIIMEEETPRAMLRNMVGATAVANAGELPQVDEEMGDGTTRTPADPETNGENVAPAPFDPVTVNLRGEDHLTLGNDMSPLGMGGDRAITVLETQPLPPPPPQAGAQANGNQPQAATRSPGATRPRGTAAPAAPGTAAVTPAPTNVVAANPDRFKVAHGDAGPFRQEDVLRSLQLLAYLTKYPHVRQEFYKKRAHIPMQANAPQASSPPSSSSSVSGKQPLGPTLAQVAPVTAALAAGQVPQITTLFSLVERFTFRPSVSHLTLHPSLQIPTIPPEIQSWAAVIMRNACRKDDTQGGIRQCANMTCGKWERTPREFAKCRRCRKAKYCGKECQSKAWSMGHRYWCSVREGTEPGQVPPENLDPENDDGSSTVVGTADAAAGAANTNTRGMGISIAPGGGVGLVPLNQANVPRGRTATTAPATTTGFAPPPNGQAMFANRAPVIMNTTGYAWDTNTLPPAPVPLNAPPLTHQPTASTSGTRRREQAPTANGTATTSAFSSNTVTTTAARERFTRGLSERLRAFQGAITPSADAATAASSSTVQPPAAATTPGSGDTSRPRAWERLFGRDTQSASPGAEVIPPEDNARSAGSTSDRAESSGGTRGYMSVSGRLNGSHRSAVPPPVQTDLSGMVRNNLVLAQQQQTTNPTIPGQWWRVAGSGSTPGTNGADDMGVD